MDEQPGPGTAAEFPVAHSLQSRNIIIYAASWGLIYLASPVTYVGLTQATLIKELGFSNTDANLPASVYMWTTALSVLVVCAFSQAKTLKPLLVGALCVSAGLGAYVTLTLALFAQQAVGAEAVKTAAVVYGAVWGFGNGVSFSCYWEIMGRGISPARRGEALGLTFGAGPICALAASLAMQSILGSETSLLSLPFLRFEFPWNFALLFGASVPIMLTCATLATLFVVPLPTTPEPREPFFASLFGGLKDFFSHRLIVLAALGYVLTYTGHQILQNISMYTEVALGEPPSRYAGYQQALRFGVKAVAGVGLGLLLIRTNPKTLLLTTTSLILLAVLWAMFVPGLWFLFAFGIFGAGELFGTYYPNYIVGCSAPNRMRRNIAFASLVTMPVGLAAVMYGFISDSFGAGKPLNLAGLFLMQDNPLGFVADFHYLLEKTRLGYQVSFAVAMGVLLLTFLMVLTLIPKQPRLKEDEPTDRLASRAGGD